MMDERKISIEDFYTLLQEQEKNPDKSVYICDYKVVSKQNKRHKKWRINKKWEKRYGTTFSIVFEDYVKLSDVKIKGSDDQYIYYSV